MKLDWFAVIEVTADPDVKWILRDEDGAKKAAACWNEQYKHQKRRFVVKPATVEVGL